MERKAFRERRRHNRAGIRMEAILQGDRPADDLRLNVLNFSAGGFFCEASRAIRPMTRLGVTFQFPPYAEHPPKKIEGMALVVRCEQPSSANGPFKVGACFTELSPDARDHIQGYVDWYKLIFGSGDPAGARQAA